MQWGSVLCYKVLTRVASPSRFLTNLNIKRKTHQMKISKLLTIIALLAGLAASATAADAPKGAEALVARPVEQTPAAEAPVSAVKGKNTFLASGVKSLGRIGNLEVIQIKIRGLDTPNLTVAALYDPATGSVTPLGTASGVGIGHTILSAGSAPAAAALLRPPTTRVNNNSNSESDADADSVSVSKGGNASAKGGNATSVSSAKNDNTSVNLNSNHNSNKNTVSSKNNLSNSQLQGQAQGQIQGQLQGQIATGGQGGNGGNGGGNTPPGHQPGHGQPGHGRD